MEYDERTRCFKLEMSESPFQLELARRRGSSYTCPEINWRSIEIFHRDDPCVRSYREGISILPDDGIPSSCSLNLDDYQREGIRFLSQGSRRAILSDIGTGKTCQVLLAFQHLKNQGKVKRLFVLCPKNTIGTWKKEFIKHLGREPGMEEFFVLNYHQLNTKTNKGYRQIKDFLETIPQKQVMICLDEIHNLASPKAQMYKTLEALLFGRDYYVTAATGTFIRNNLGSFFGPYTLLTRANVSIREYDKLFKINGTYYSYEGAGKLLEPIIKRFSIRHTLKDLGIKETRRQIQPIMVPMGVEQRGIYNRILGNYREKLRMALEEHNEKMKWEAFGELSRLVTACSHPVVWDDNFPDDQVNKMEALDELLDQLWAEGKSVVVWSQHPKILERIALRHPENNPIIIPGGLTAKQLEDRKDKFCQGDSKLLLLSLGACNSGMDGLQFRCHNAVYYDAGWKPTEYTQSYGRIDRRGQESPIVNYYHLIYEGMIDETIFTRIQDKLNLSETAYGDKYKTTDDILQGIMMEDIKRR